MVYYSHKRKGRKHHMTTTDIMNYVIRNFGLEHWFTIEIMHCIEWGADVPALKMMIEYREYAMAHDEFGFED